jgi:hypothetical protein
MDAQMIDLSDERVGSFEDARCVDVGRPPEELLHRVVWSLAGVRVPTVGKVGEKGCKFFLLKRVRLGHAANRRPGLERAEGGDQRYLIFPIPLTYVLEYFVAPSTAEIEVDIRRIGPGGAEKALEEQIVPDGINGGNPGAVGDQ